MVPKDSARISGKIAALAGTYLPEWRFDPAAPDSGTALATLVGEMLDDSAQRLDKAVHKHKIAYLNLFDKLKTEPIESARSFVRFSPVIGAPGPVHVPKGTRIFAEHDEDDRRIIFETTHGITAVDTQLMDIYATDGVTDRICKLFPKGVGGSDAENASFTAFDLTDGNLSRHRLLLAFDSALDELESFELGLRILTVDPAEAEAAAQALTAPGMIFAMLDPEEERVPVESVEVRGNVIWLKNEGYQPRKVEMDSENRYVVEITAPGPCPVAISSVELCLKGSDISPDGVWCGGMEQMEQRFHPFGSPMEIYAECGMESLRVFSKKGARVGLSFHLDFDVWEQKLPELEEDTQYKVIMKKPVELPKIAPRDIYADYVLLEYLSTRGWKRLLADEHSALLFNTSVNGRIDIAFDCPMDLVEPDDAPDGYRLRFRLLRAENLYQIPCRQYCPVITGLHFSYDYTGGSTTPDKALVHNNFKTEDVTELFDKQRTVKLFTSEEYQKTCMYLGFSQSPSGTPLSMYLNLENRADYPVDMTVEYLGPRGFETVKVVDGTAGLRYSGTMLMLIPSDCVSGTLFGQERYWLRIVDHNREADFAELPIVSGIYLNMARVENRSTNIKYFYVEDAASPFHIELGEGDIISARVTVNEQGGPSDADHWVEWQARNGHGITGRVYDIDLTAGTIDFARGVFASFPVREEEAAVKVEYQSYLGSAANVPKEAIHVLSSAIPFIGSVSNPIPAFGGYDGYNEQTSAAMISSLLRTRGRAVTSADYLDIISQATFGVRRIKALSDIDQHGSPRPDAITIALLIDQYDQGGHIFSSIKEKVRSQLEDRSCVLPLGKELILTQPHFLPLSVRLWLECGSMENTYDLQKQTIHTIEAFLNPLDGSFEGHGWEIGVLPTSRQLLAYLGVRHPGLAVSRLAMTVTYGNREFAVDDMLSERIKDPFAMAVSGEHTVYVDLPARF